MPRKKENDIVLPPPLSRTPVNASPEVAIPVEEPKFYGAAFATLMRTYRKAGTLREKNAKRAGLTKGMRLTGHVHEKADSPSIYDPGLVILDVYHGPLRTVYGQHSLAFLLDGINNLDEAVHILQGFTQNQITPFTEIDYFTFTYQSLFDALPEDLRTRLLSLPIERAIIDPAFAHLFYPTLCQAAVWHGHDAKGWIEILERLKAIDSKRGKALFETRVPGSQTTQGPANFVGNEDMQEILDGFDPDKGPNSEYRLLVLAQPDAFDRLKQVQDDQLLEHESRTLGTGYEGDDEL